MDEPERACLRYPSNFFGFHFRARCGTELYVALLESMFVLPFLLPLPVYLLPFRLSNLLPHVDVE